MTTSQVIKVQLRELERDPLLPPRIVNEDRLEALARSMGERGMAQPILARPAPTRANDGGKYYIVLGYRRFLAAGLLQWQTVDVIVDDGLTDQEVVLLAFDAGRTTDSRTPLEDAWYYASMHQTGMTQAAIAEREGVSTGKANMYIRVGRVITSDRITATGLDPKHVAQLPITTLGRRLRSRRKRLRAGWSRRSVLTKKPTLPLGRTFLGRGARTAPVTPMSVTPTSQRGPQKNGSRQSSRWAPCFRTPADWRAARIP